jgi:MFS family permease
MAIPAQVWKSLLAVIVVAIGTAIAIPLGRYADRDDAPGGVLIAFMIFIAATALAAWIVNTERSAKRKRESV